MDASSTVPGRAQNQLWPIPPQLHQYIDNWVAYVTELERRIVVMQEASLANETGLTQKISELRVQLGALEKPLLDKISVLEQSNVQHRIETDALRRELDDAVKLLAAALEVPGKSLSLIGLIQEAVLLVEEAKVQLRESL